MTSDAIALENESVTFIGVAHDQLCRKTAMSISASSSLEQP
jgi:hypothetical protein